nr:SAM-dependent methyltransferase [Microbispora rosea]
MDPTVPSMARIYDYFLGGKDNFPSDRAAIAPDARVAYVDNDPIVLVHARALLADPPETIVLEGGLRRPKEILDDPQIRDHFDFTQPIAILVLALLHSFTDEDSVRGVTATLRDALPSGGYLVVSHAYSATIDEDKADEVRSVYSKTSADGIVHRGPAALAPHFDGMELLEPGVVPVESWRPRDDTYPGDPSRSGYVGAVARKP